MKNPIGKTSGSYEVELDEKSANALKKMLDREPTDLELACAAFAFIAMMIRLRGRRLFNLYRAYRSFLWPPGSSWQRRDGTTARMHGAFRSRQVIRPVS